MYDTQFTFRQLFVRCFLTAVCALREQSAWEQGGAAALLLPFFSL